MKRPRLPATSRPVFMAGDIKRDLTKEQLAAIGAISLAYNKAEDRIDDLFGVVTALDGQMRLEVSTRINGIDGKIAIITHGAKEFGLTDEEQFSLEELLGEGVFKKLKKYREAVIHSRINHAPVGIGYTIERKAKINEVLLSQNALDALYDHLIACCSELSVAAAVLQHARTVNNAAPDDPNREQHEANRSGSSAQFRRYRTLRQSLPPIPEFPSESEFHEAELQWQQSRQAELWGWMSSWDIPQHAPHGQTRAYLADPGGRPPPPLPGEK
jgi:hypothetical protein